MMSDGPTDSSEDISYTLNSYLLAYRPAYSDHCCNVGQLPTDRLFDSHFKRFFFMMFS